MNYLKDLFVKGRYWMFIGCGVLFQVQRTYWLPRSKIYKQVYQDTQKQLDYIDPETDHSSLKLEELDANDLNRLKAKTKKQVTLMQGMALELGTTYQSTGWILMLGAVNYFVHPTLCGLFVASYLTLLQVDFVKNVIAIKYGHDALWQWKMKDFGYVMTVVFASATIAILMRNGLARIKERALAKHLSAKQVPKIQENIVKQIEASKEERKEDSR